MFDFRAFQTRGRDPDVGRTKKSRGCKKYSILLKLIKILYLRKKFLTLTTVLSAKLPNTLFLVRFCPRF